MISLFLLPGLLLLALFGALALRARRTHRRQALRARPFPPAWDRILERNVPLYTRLPAPLRDKLRGDISVFLAEKNFEGAAGLKLTDEMRLTIAANACVLTLNRPATYYPRLRSIIVYPHEFDVEVAFRVSENQHVETTETRLGESWHAGAVVLAWSEVQQAASGVHPGRNVVLHEFAHQLDQEDGVANGAPVLDRGSQYVSWASTLGHEYERLREASASGEPTLLDRYGAESEAEFFAVATECFFGLPRRMRQQHPELYDTLKTFYNQDPATYE